jgi:hypothetical protein
MAIPIIYLKTRKHSQVMMVGNRADFRRPVGETPLSKYFFKRD